MDAIFGEGKIFWKLPRVHSLDTLWVKNFDEIALSRMVKEIEAILCFAIFGKNSKIQNGHHFWGGENFLKIAIYCSNTLWVENFDEIALSRTVKEIQAILCFAIFCKNSKWPPFLGRGKFFENWQEYIPSIHCQSKISTKSLYLARLRRYKQFCVLSFWAKIQNGHHFWGGENFFENWVLVNSLHTLWVENFDEIALSCTVKEIQAILCFVIFGKNSKWLPFLGRGKFF